MQVFLQNVLICHESTVILTFGLCNDSGGWEGEEQWHCERQDSGQQSARREESDGLHGATQGAEGL